jgi:hypothetical protein
VIAPRPPADRSAAPPSGLPPKISGCRTVAPEAAHAAPLPIPNRSSYTRRQHRHAAPGSRENACAARLRTPNGFRHCENGRNAQMSLIVIHPDISDMSQTKLFEPFKLGPITLPNRLVMAPLTRNRAVPPGMVPSPLAVDYYGQRASAGLLITEASQVSQQGQGYQDTPGIYSKEQVAGWRKVTDRVHEKGGRIFIQIWHVGRISHDSLQPGGGKPVAPSAIRAKGKTFVNGTFTDISEPRALELSEIPGIIEDFKRGTENALAAGFDGIEIHGANGYLARPVRQGRHQQADGRLWRLDREPCQADAGGVQGGGRGGGPRAHRHPHLAGDAGERRLR